MDSIDLNVWTVLLFIAGVQGVFLFVIFMLKKRNSNSIKLALIILSYSLLLLYYVSYWTGYLNFLPWQVHLLSGVPMLIAPLFYSYILQFKSNNSTVVDFKYYLPLLVFETTILLNSLSFHLGFNFYTSLFSEYSSHFFALLHCAILAVFSYLIWKVNDFKKGTHKWVNSIKRSYLIFAGGTIVYYVLLYANLLDRQTDYMISVVMALFIYYVGYKGFLNTSFVNVEKLKYEKTAISSQVGESLKNKIIKHLELTKAYKSNEYKLGDLADDTGIPAHIVSQVINQFLLMSFNDLINSYRIKEAKILIGSHPELSNIAIAYRSGFNNRVTFNNCFKKFTSYSISDYRKMYSETDNSVSLQTASTKG